MAAARKRFGTRKAGFTIHSSRDSDFCDISGKNGLKRMNKGVGKRNDMDDGEKLSCWEAFFRISCK